MSLIYTVAMTPATVGTRRRIQAMTWNGWPLHIQATLAEIHPREYAALLRRIEVDSETAKRVDQAYQRLSMRIARRCRQSRKLRWLAVQRGWYPPLAWDDDDDAGHDLDDPRAIPCVLPEGLRTPKDAVDELLVQSWAAGHPAARSLDFNTDALKPTRNELIYRLAREGTRTKVLAELFGLRSTNQVYDIAQGRSKKKPTEKKEC